MTNPPLDILLLTAKFLFEVVLNPQSIRAELRARLLKPRPGDWVVEIHRGMTKLEACAVGRLILGRVEPCSGEWGDEPTPTEDIWYIESAEGKLVRWRECQFMTLPDFHDPSHQDLSGEKELWVAKAIERHGLH